MQEFSKWEAMVESATRIINSSVHRVSEYNSRNGSISPTTGWIVLSPQHHRNVFLGVRRLLMYLHEVALRRHLSSFPQSEPFRVGVRV